MQDQAYRAKVKLSFKYRGEVTSLRTREVEGSGVKRRLQRHALRRPAAVDCALEYILEKWIPVFRNVSRSDKNLERYGQFNRKPSRSRSCGLLDSKSVEA